MDLDDIFNIRYARRLPLVYPRNNDILKVFATFSFLGFFLIYLEVSRLLIPDTVLTLRDLRQLTKGFANDISSYDRAHRLLIPHNLLAVRRQKTSAILIGFSHCGATQILDELALHTDIVVNRNTHHFFDGNHTEQWYISKLPTALSHHVTVDSCLGCIANHSALKLIRSFDKNIRVIIVVCNPLMRLLLHHATSAGIMQRMSFKSEDSRTNEHISDSEQNGTRHVKEREVIGNDTHTPTSQTAQVPSKTETIRHTNTTNPTKVFPSIEKDKSERDHFLTKIQAAISSLDIFNITNDNTSTNASTSMDNSILREIGDILHQMSLVFQLFPANRVHVMDIQQFNQDKEREQGRLNSFLRMSTDIQHFKRDQHRNNISRRERSVNQSEIKVLEAQTLFRLVRAKDKDLFQQLLKFYTTLQNNSLNYMQEKDQL